MRENPWLQLQGGNPIRCLADAHDRQAVIALRPGRLRQVISDSSTASDKSGQRRNKDFNAHLASMRAS